MRSKTVSIFRITMDEGAYIGQSSAKTYTLTVEDIDRGEGVTIFQCEVLGKSAAREAFDYLVKIHKALPEGALAQ